MRFVEKGGRPPKELNEHDAKRFKEGDTKIWNELLYNSPFGSTKDEIREFFKKMFPDRAGQIASANIGATYPW